MLKTKGNLCFCFFMTDIYRQDGGLPNLGLAAIDPHLDFTGKSIERISDPEFRLIALWTTIGQYAASAAQQRTEHGSDIPTVDEARYHQLIERWTLEMRRVYPVVRSSQLFEKNEGVVTKLIGSGKYLLAYHELLELRTDYPEFLHADVRFDLMTKIYESSTNIGNGDIFLSMVLREMLDETLPGGPGYCDNTERLRRYHRLSEWDLSMDELLLNYVQRAKAGADQDPAYFTSTEDEISSVLTTVVDRRYADLAMYLVQTGTLSFDESAYLLGAV